MHAPGGVAGRRRHLFRALLASPRPLVATQGAYEGRFGPAAAGGGFAWIEATALPRGVALAQLSPRVALAL